MSTIPVQPSLAPVEYLAEIANGAYPHINVPAVTPSVDDVALLLQTRTISAGGGPLSTFTDATRPSAEQVAGIIYQAIIVICEQFKQDVPTYLYPRVKQAIAFQAAVLVEDSFFREQVTNGQSNAASYAALVTTIMGNVVGDAGNAAGAARRVDSVVLRSTMTDYDEIYPLPPPRQVIALRSVEQESTAGALSGTVVLVAGQTTVANPSVTSETTLTLEVTTENGTPGVISYVVTPGVGITISSTSPTDASEVFYQIQGY
jgi:hypothetical protein